MILKNEGKRLPQQDTTRYMTDNNAAEIKSLSYVCKDRNINHPNIIKRKEMERYPCTKFQQMK